MRNQSCFPINFSHIRIKELHYDQSQITFARRLTVEYIYRFASLGTLTAKFS